MLVCGLGAMGQACLQRLLQFGVPLRCLDLRPPSWRDPDLEQRLLGSLTLGDMRLPRVLRQANAHQCRAVLLLSSDSTANFEAALQVRLLNPTAEIVVRSARHQASLGALLEQRLPGIAVIDPILLCADAITSALRPGGGSASIEVDGTTYQLSEAPWRHPRLEKPIRLPPASAGALPMLLTPRSLHRSATAKRGQGPDWRKPWRGLRWLQDRTVALWRSLSPPQQLSALVLVLLTGLGVQIFARFQGWTQGMFVTLALLKGEYVDPVNVLLSGRPPSDPISGWLVLLTLAYSLVGTLITSAIVAVILERLLRERLGQRRRRLHRGDQHPVLLVGGDALAREVGRRLKRQGHPVVRVEVAAGDGQEEGAVAYQSLDEAITALASREVAAIGVLSTDLLQNLREALALQQQWPAARLAVLAHAFGAAEQLGQLLGGMGVISAVDLVADAVVATAFGERVEGVLRLRGLNLLIVRYRIRPGDTLSGLTIARLENGYGITAVSLTRAQQPDPIVLPAPDLVLVQGDQLVVLASSASLRSVELGAINPPRCRLRLRFPTGQALDRRFEVQQILARWLGCPPGEVLGLLDGDDHLLPALDDDIADLLRQELRRQGVPCGLEQEPGSAAEAPEAAQDDCSPGPR